MTGPPMSSRGLGRFRLAILAATGIAALAGCAGEITTDDPLGEMRDQKLSAAKRIKGGGRAWDDGQQGKIDKVAVREGLKTVAWSASWPLELREAALRALLGDTNPKGV